MLSRSSPAGWHAATRTPRRAGRTGLTLLEVLVSAAIFFMALVGIATLIGLGSDLALATQHRTEALQLAQSKMSQVVLGAIDLKNSQQNAAIPPEETPNGATGWTWSLDSSQADITQPAALYNVKITVQRQRDDGSTITVTLSQLVIDPTQRGTNQAPSNYSGTAIPGTTNSASGMSGSQ
jgi:type II secretion system protein I